MRMTLNNKEDGVVVFLASVQDFMDAETGVALITVNRDGRATCGDKETLIFIKL